jgi:hypothetical protein
MPFHNVARRRLPLPFSAEEGRYRKGISMTHSSAPLLIATTMYFMMLPAPALAHGLPSVVATFIISFLALALVAPTLTDFFAIKRWLFKVRARLAAILANLTAAAVAGTPAQCQDVWPGRASQGGTLSGRT